MSLKLSTHPKLHLYVCIVAVTMSLKASAFPAVPEYDRFIDREFASPGGHQLASWLTSKLRKGDDFLPLEEITAAAGVVQPPTPFRLPLMDKRNSELTSVMMGFPKTMIDNGRK